jgi:predicted aspartyl protease
MSRRFRLSGTRQALLLVLAVALLGGMGCQRATENSIPTGAHEVKMVVLKGPKHETLALVPVYIDGKGPFSFALDTGASRTVVDRRVAEELGLPVAGSEESVKGVGGKAVAYPVRVGSWSVADFELHPSTLDALDLSEGGRASGLQGLLGSDMLSRFHVIHVDYKNERLIFHAGPSGQLAALP